MSMNTQKWLAVVLAVLTVGSIEQTLEIYRNFEKLPPQNASTLLSIGMICSLCFLSAAAFFWWKGSKQP